VGPTKQYDEREDQNLPHDDPRRLATIDDGRSTIDYNPAAP
jgi:hypothetical protein